MLATHPLISAVTGRHLADVTFYNIASGENVRNVSVGSCLKLLSLGCEVFGAGEIQVVPLLSVPPLTDLSLSLSLSLSDS